jgi:hypothetical protein
MFVWWKYWLPGLLLGVASGVASYWLILWGGNQGYALFLSVPLSVGAILGYGTEVSFLVSLLLGLVAVASIVLVLVFMNLSGLFCGAVGGAILLGPVFLGMLLGYLLRQLLKTSRWDQRFYLPLAAFLALPPAADRLERSFPHPPQTATVVTRVILEGPPDAAWKSVLFYEEVRHHAPLLLRLALPRPVRSEGKKDGVGNQVRCLYQRGHLLKRITRLEEGRLLAFEVLEQELHFERDLTLLDGSFGLEPLPSGGSLLSLTTRYRRRLRPSWLWEPIEEAVTRTLHRHIAEGMRRNLRASLAGSLALEDLPRSGSLPATGL